MSSSELELELERTTGRALRAEEDATTTSLSSPEVSRALAGDGDNETTLEDCRGRFLFTFVTTTSSLSLSSLLGRVPVEIAMGEEAAGWVVRGARSLSESSELKVGRTVFLRFMSLFETVPEDMKDFLP